MILRFYKEDIRWYIDLPEWTGAKADLEMVAGADTMLDMVSKNTNEVVVDLSLDEVDGALELEYLGLATEIGEGAYYKLKEYEGKEINLEMWLCGVTLFVLKVYPNFIYITPVYK